ncbi:hypothetical protein ABVK25_012211 [Lepraria finkii]|uniref:Uncharacterized protein n=1 Tax=Lepraria finkii TaxID=1340010 RepID=A0ABR4AIX5_9LECA
MELKPPPEGLQASTLEELIIKVQEHAGKEGYAVIKKQGSHNKRKSHTEQAFDNSTRREPSGFEYIRRSEETVAATQQGSTQQGSTQQGSIQARDGNTTITAEPASGRDVQLPQHLAAQEAEEQEVDAEANAFFTTSAGEGRGRGGAREQGLKSLLAYPPRRRGGTRQRGVFAATTSRGGATRGGATRGGATRGGATRGGAIPVWQRSGQAMFGGYGVFDPAAW